MTKQIERWSLEGCFRKGFKVTHYTTLKDGTKPCCKTCPGTKEYAEKNELPRPKGQGIKMHK